MEKCYTVLLEHVYPGGYSVPSGYEEVSFRPPRMNEDYMIANEVNAKSISIATAMTENYYAYPRIVVRKKPPLRRWIVEEIPSGLQYDQNDRGLSVIVTNSNPLPAQRHYARVIEEIKN